MRSKCATFCVHAEAEHETSADGKLQLCRKCPCWYVGEPKQMERVRVPSSGAEIGQHLKEVNLAAAEINHRSDLEAARLIRDRLTIERREVTADDVREVFEKHRPNAWGPWAGALFRGDGYVATGEFRPSKFASNHGAVIRVWRKRA